MLPHTSDLAQKGPRDDELSGVCTSIPSLSHSTCSFSLAVLSQATSLNDLTPTVTSVPLPLLSDLTPTTLPPQSTLPNISINQKLSHSVDPIPQVFVVIPPRKDHSRLSLRREVRIVVPCQGLSVNSGCDDLLHITSHEGYVLECPGDFEHRNRDGVKFLSKALVHLLRALQIVGGFMWNISNRPGEAATAILSAIQMTADNKARLNTVGIDTDSMFLVQVIADSHQMRAMEELLRSAAESRGQSNITGDLQDIVLENGRRIWVCKRCYDCLQRGDRIEESNYLTLSQYASLATRESEVEVTLCNAESVIFLAESLLMSTKTNKLTIHIDPTYFEDPDRATGTRYNSVVKLFIHLGQVLKNQKGLVHLEIHGRSTNGKMYTGLNAVFKCRSLKILRISGMPCLLQGKSIQMRCRKLIELSLKHVRFDTEQSAGNFWELIGASPHLKTLKVTSSVLSMVKPRATMTQLGMVESLDLSSNDLCGQQATSLLRMVLASDEPGLRFLNLSSNPRIGDSGCQSILGILWTRSHWLEGLKVQSTGIKDPRTTLSINTYLSSHSRTHSAI